MFGFLEASKLSLRFNWQFNWQKAMAVARLSSVLWGVSVSFGSPGGWCSSGAVRFEKSSVCLRNVTNLRKKRSQGGSGIFFKGKKSFFPGPKLFFSGAKTFFFGCLKNEYQTDTPQRTETRKAKRARTKIAQNFFFYWTKLFF